MEVETVLDGDCTAEQRHRNEAEVGLFDREAAARLDDFTVPIHCNLHRDFTSETVECDRYAHVSRGGCRSGCRGRHLGSIDCGERVGPPDRNFDERIPLDMQHAFEHVGACPRDVGGRRLRGEMRCAPQFGLVDAHPVEPRVEISASCGDIDKSAYVTARDDVVVAEACELATAVDDYGDE
ncbi:MAG TPA: hypothetical protein VFU90_04250 [Candidatus Tumulicola sp.]|nr:hypothetical protein [Candidatus Tumulicola sp.]